MSDLYMLKILTNKRLKLPIRFSNLNNYLNLLCHLVQSIKVRDKVSTRIVLQVKPFYLGGGTLSSNKKKEVDELEPLLMTELHQCICERRAVKTMNNTYVTQYVILNCNKLTILYTYKCIKRIGWKCPSGNKYSDASCDKENYNFLRV